MEGVPGIDTGKNAFAFGRFIFAVSPPAARADG